MLSTRLECISSSTTPELRSFEKSFAYATFSALLQALYNLSSISSRPFYGRISHFVAGKNAEWRNLVVKKCDSIFSER